MTPCRYCVAPKRKPGCKSTCPEYGQWLPGEIQRKETISKAIKENNPTRLKYITDAIKEALRIATFVSQTWERTAYECLLDPLEIDNMRKAFEPLEL